MVSADVLGADSFGPAPGSKSGAKAIRTLKGMLGANSRRSPHREPIRRMDKTLWSPDGSGESMGSNQNPRPTLETTPRRRLSRFIARRRAFRKLSNILPIVRRTDEDLDVDIDCILDRICVPRTCFAFAELRKRSNVDGSLELEGEILESSPLCCEGCLSFAEIGRQLGTLGLVAMCESDWENCGHFYVGDQASVEEYVELHDPKPFFRGLAHVAPVDLHTTKAVLELWQSEHLVCKMSMLYRIVSSWEELLDV